MTGNSRQDAFGFAGHSFQLFALTPPGDKESESLSWHCGGGKIVKQLQFDNSLWPQPDTMYEEEFSFSLRMLPHLKPGAFLMQQKPFSAVPGLRLPFSVSQTPDLIMTARLRVIHANLLWPSKKNLPPPVSVGKFSSGNSQAVALWKQAQRELWAVGSLPSAKPQLRRGCAGRSLPQPRK